MTQSTAEINQAIRDRQLHQSNDDGTYFTQDLFNFAVDNHDDPLVLFKIKVLGYYARVYKWTVDQAMWFIEHNAKDAYSHSDGEIEYLYDWGRAKNKLTDHPMHEPHLDHIDPHSLSKNDRPENFRIRCARLNENKGNMVSDLERRATIIDMFKDMDAPAQRSLLDYLATLVSSNHP
jgi:hypothetical protein